MSLAPPLSKDDHVRGDLPSDITLVEYGDFECPFCGAAYPIIRKINEDMPEIAFAFRNFPLSNSHPNAFDAACAAEAAARQGKYWEMHDLLFQNQDDLSAESLTFMAEQMGLDMKRFSKDMASVQVKKKVESDFESGVRSGVNGTPTFFVNGERYDRPVRDLEEYLENRLAQIRQRQ